MLQFESKHGVRFSDGPTRRDFLRAGAVTAGTVGLSLADLARAGGGKKDINCILLFLVGGPSHLDTWDLKPDAPDNVRGPFKPIATNVPGIDICEHFPLMARMADRYAIVRSVHHTAAPIHETGHQLMQTGHLFRGGQEFPHYGAVLSHVRGPAAEGVPPFVVLPGPISHTGVSVSHGQGAGFLGEADQPFILHDDPAHHYMGDGSVANRLFWIGSELAEIRDRYGWYTFGSSCLLARRLIENGVRLVTVNMFDTVFNEVTWDCHADGGSLASSLDNYRDMLCPLFDKTYTALLDDLHQRGMLDNTLVVAMGEFGRTPHLNPRGGRDHWPGVWSILMAGGGIRGGQVVGSSDAIGAEPKDRPVTPGNVAATIYAALGVPLNTRLTGANGRSGLVAEEAPIAELLR